MADKGLERSAKVVTAGTPTPNPICKIFLPKFEISISDKRKKRNDSKYMFTLVFTNIKKLQKMLEYLQNNRFFGTRFRARAKAKVTSRLSVKQGPKKGAKGRRANYASMNRIKQSWLSLQSVSSLLQVEGSKKSQT